MDTDGPRSILKNRGESTHADQTDIEQNTLANANANGRSGDVSLDGQSITSPSTRLKWDEANLYLTEQEKNSTMKITEPKTPYAPTYDPSEDAEDIAMLDEAENRENGASPRMSKMEDIPTLDIGVPEQEMEIDDAPKRKVSVSGGSSETEGAVGSRTPEEEAKHQRFEKMRREHYGGAAAALRRASTEGTVQDKDSEEEV